MTEGNGAVDEGTGGRRRITSAVTSISWIPSEAIEGLTRLPFDAGVFHYDAPPPDHLDDLGELHRADAFREANELRGWIEVENGRIVSYGQGGRALLGKTRLKLGPVRVAVPAVPMPTLRPEPIVSDTAVTFVQTVGGRMALPAPRRVSFGPHFHIASSLAWTTLGLTIHVDGSCQHEVLGASPFPRHWIYGDGGRLLEKSGLIDFNGWYRGSFGKHTPWGESDSPALITAVETELERELSVEIMQHGPRPRMKRLEPGQTLVEQGDLGDDLFLLLDGMLAVEIDGAELNQVGPGAILGERAGLEDGRRKATLRAVTRSRVAVVPSFRVPEPDLARVAKHHRLEESS